VKGIESLGVFYGPFGGGGKTRLIFFTWVLPGQGPLPIFWSHPPLPPENSRSRGTWFEKKSGRVLFERILSGASYRESSDGGGPKKILGSLFKDELPDGKIFANCGCRWASPIPMLSVLSIKVGDHLPRKAGKNQRRLLERGPLPVGLFFELSEIRKKVSCARRGGKCVEGKL